MKFKNDRPEWYHANRILHVIMKSILFLCCTLAFAIHPGCGFSQNTVVDIKDHQSISIEQLFSIIELQTNHNFIYNHNKLRNAPFLEVKKGKIKTSELLEQGLAQAGYTYTMNGNTVVVRKKTINDYKKPDQETFQIKGKVTNEFGEPIIGASIVASTDIFNKNQIRNPDFVIRGTQTDFDGNFTLEVSIGNTLNAYYLGFEDYNVQITDKTERYDIVLKEDINQLDEVVLTGYTKTEKEKSTAAASKITKKDIARQKAINLSDRLEGLSPGLNINSVTPAGGSRRSEIILRGISTFDRTDDQGNSLIDAQNSLNRQPLIVLDGFPYEGPFNDIDPQTIETIDILRDAAATTLWGIRASNGVIVVTTKRGSKNSLTPTITFSSNLTIGTGQDLNDLGLASAAETIKVFNNNYNLNSDFTNAGRLFNGNNPIDQYRAINAFDQIWGDFLNPNGGISVEERDRRLAELAQNNVLDDFQRYLLSPGFIRENSLSIRNGSDAISYNFTATYVDQDLPDAGDKFQRLNLSLTTDFELTKKLNATIDASLTSSEANDNGIGVAALTSGDIRIFDRLVDANGDSRAIRQTYTENRNEFLNLGFEDGSFNPILDQSLRDNENKNFNLRLAAGLNYKITNWLTADVKYQYNKITNTINNNKDVRLFETRTNNNNFIVEPIQNDNNFVERNVPFGGTLENSVTNTVNSIVRGTLQFNKTFNNLHTISALAGMEVSENTIELNRRTYYGYNDRTGISDTSFDPRQVDTPLPGFLIPSFLQGFTRPNFNNAFTPEVKSRAISSFGNIGYSYKSKYNLTLSGKIDQTTAFGINERLSKPLLWAIGGSWNIAEEGFFKSNWVNVLKLRGSYGVNGNLRRGLTTRVTIDFRENNDLNGRPFAQITSSGNPNLTFEETTTTNIGLDFGFFDGKISGSVDVYDRLSENLLVPFNINPTFGQEVSILRNDGSISNRGIEVNLNLDILRKGDFNWNANLNVSYNKNEVLSFSENNDPLAFFLIGDVDDDNQQIIGRDISTRLRFEWAGLDREGNPQIFDENGDIIGFLEGPPSIDALVETKPFIAPAFGGFRNTFNYKDFSFSFLASFKFGHVFQEDLNSKYAGAAVLHRDIANAWQFPGDELRTDIPALPRTDAETGADRADFFRQSNFGLHNASFIRLRDVTLGYTLANKATSSIGLDAINFTLQVRNLGLLWRANDVGLDPESVPFSVQSFSFSDAFTQAFRPGIIPPVTIVLGVNFNF